MAAKNINWDKEFSSLDKKVHENVSKWTGSLPNGINALPLFDNFQEHLMHVIMSFLAKENSGKEPQELFIQVPLEELANRNKKNENLQTETFRKFVGTAATCLFLSTSKSILQNNDVKDDFENRIECGRFYFVHNKTIGNIILHCVSSNDWCSIRDDYYDCSNPPQFDDNYPRFHNNQFVLYYCQRGKAPTTVNDRFLNNCDTFFEIKGEITRRHQAIDQMRKEIASLQSLQQFSCCQYNSAALVTKKRYNPLNENLSIESKYFETISLVNDINIIKRKARTEIIVAMGDDMYHNRLQAYRARGFKKIIYIGTESPNESIQTYPFTFREMYRYCAPNNSNGFSFKEPVFINGLNFPWLEQQLEDLKKLLANLSQYDDMLLESQDDIVLFFRSIFSDIHFNKERWSKRKQRIDDLLTNIVSIECKSDTIESIINWAKAVEYNEESNPKEKVIANLKLRNPIIIGKYDSYKTAIKKLVRYNNSIVIDSASFSTKSGISRDTAYRFVISNHLFPNVYALYYEHENHYANRLRWFLNKEFTYYNNQLRTDYSTNIELPENEKRASSLEDIELTDWETDAMLWWSSENKVTCFTFDDGDSLNIDGDILVFEDDAYDRITVSETDEASIKGKRILFYQNPDIFEEYKKAYQAQAEQDIDKYSRLWQQAIHDYYEQELRSNPEQQQIIKTIESQTGIKTSVFKKYLTGDCINKFFGKPRHMQSMCRFLVDKKMLASTEADMVRKAKQLHSQSSTQFGKDLKNEVLSYKQGLDGNYPIITEIARCMEIDCDRIVESCLHSGIVIKMEIK